MALSRIQIMQMANLLQNQIPRSVKSPGSVGGGPFEGQTKEADRMYSAYTGNPIPKTVEEVTGRGQPVARAEQKVKEQRGGR